MARAENEIQMRSVEAEMGRNLKGGKSTADAGPSKAELTGIAGNHN